MAANNFVVPATGNPTVTAVEDISEDKGECVICGDELPFDELFPTPCEHAWCKTCVVRAFAAAYRFERNYPPGCCPNSDSLDVDDYPELFCPRFRRVYREKEAEYHCPRRNRLYCANTSCGEWVPTQSICYGAFARGYCRECCNVTCMHCKELIPYGAEHACAGDETERLLLEQIEGLNLKRCIDCGYGIELAEACNHITCSECGAQFCYVCGRAWQGLHGCPQYNAAVYDADGFNEAGYHRDTGLNRAGRDFWGFDADGYDAGGLHRDTRRDRHGNLAPQERADAADAEILWRRREPGYRPEVLVAAARHHHAQQRRRLLDMPAPPAHGGLPNDDDDEDALEDAVLRAVDHAFREREALRGPPAVDPPRLRQHPPRVLQLPAPALPLNHEDPQPILDPPPPHLPHLAFPAPLPWPQQPWAQQLAQQPQPVDRPAPMQMDALRAQIMHLGDRLDAFLERQHRVLDGEMAAAAEDAARQRERGLRQEWEAGQLQRREQEGERAGGEEWRMRREEEASDRRYWERQRGEMGMRIVEREREREREEREREREEREREREERAWWRFAEWWLVRAAARRAERRERRRGG